MSATPPLTLVLPGLLTPSPAAAELARQLPAPTLLRWLESSSHAEEAFDPLDAGCAAREFCWLRRAGFDPAGAGVDKPGAGLAPLLAPADGGGPVWLAELAHIQIGRDGLVMTDPATLELEPADGAALLAAAGPALDDGGFRAEALAPGRWRIHAPPRTARHTGTPEAVAGRPLENWWPRGEQPRPWRRLVNEVQMLWHEHPVNEAREARGLPAVNGLWLHGGAAPWRANWPGGAPAAVAGASPWLRRLAQDAALPWRGADAPAGPLAGAVVELDALDAAERGEDWHAWLAALARLERDWFAPVDALLHAGRLGGLELVLPSPARLATLRLEHRPAWLRWLPRTKRDWKHWWLPRES